ncbi:hypothetical protein PVL29_005717 [Vitis rotundifolia]|uniref:UspA domain-containing protein n=1 Tax=Vitis rotundifolia TaxID=103349 RepID=A0AA39DWZ8_VITRO|nr:hypothetical protein PVL29_005717 [Vitis rotundifolia]
METTERPVLVIGIDDSSHSFYALEWTLDHFFSPPKAKPFKLVIVYARPPPSSVIGCAGPGIPDIIAHVDSDLKKAAARMVDKAKQMCKSKSVEDVTVSVMEGDARIIICDVVNTHHASILVVGSHGYGALKRAVLGSVSDYCAHHAHCTVMIVKKPKY